MISGFIDLCILRLDDTMVKILSRLKYYAVVYIDSTVRNIKGDLRLFKGRILSNAKLSDLKDELKGIRGEYDFVIVEPTSIATARFSAHDTRINGILLSKNSVRFIDKGQINTMKQYGKPLLLDLRIMGVGDPRISSMAYRRIILARYYGVDIIPASCATSFNELLIPQTTMYFLEEMTGIPHTYWVYAVGGLARELVLGR
jgi:ribonuclease P/MRP protein subunit RPP1